MEDLLKRAQRLMASSWFWYLLLGIPVLVVVWSLAWTAFQDGKRLAQLEANLEKEKERKRDLEARQQIGALDSEQVTLNEELAHVNVNIERVEAELKEETERHEQVVKDVESVTNWSEYWSYLGEGGTDEGSTDAPSDNGQAG